MMASAVRRIRPKMMTVVTTFIALLPILWATGTGADVMRRTAAPMVGGVVTSFVGELLVYPAVFFVWQAIGLRPTELFPKQAAALAAGAAERSQRDIDTEGDA